MSITRFDDKNLNDKAAFEIFRHLDLTSLRQARLTRKDWNAVIKKTIWPDGYSPITHAFQETVKRHPHALFLQSKDHTLTYLQANKLINQLAHHLISLKLPHEAKIAVYLPNSPALFLTILAIWKAGLVYLPLPFSEDVSQDKLKLYVDDCQPSILVTTKERTSDDIVRHWQATASTTMLHVETTGELVNAIVNPLADHDENPAIEIAPNQLAYLIYTSGKVGPTNPTGKPKGVMIEHKGLVNSLAANAEAIALTGADKVLQLSATSFDAHIMELGMPFATRKAATLTIMPREANGRLPIREIGPVCATEKVTVCILTPGMLEQQEQNDFQSVRAIISTGEPLFEKTIRLWAAGRTFINGYGPKEVTICTTLGQHRDEDKSIHIGKAIKGLQTFFLPIPKDERSLQEYELAIAGYGLARGFYNDPALTNQRYKWIPHPDKPDEMIRVYQTGDCVEVNADQNLEFITRYDDQLKVHGKLIRTGETQHVLNDFSNEFVAHVGTIKYSDPERHPIIVAYLFRKPGVTLQLEKLWAHIRKKLASGTTPTWWYDIPLADYNKCLNSNNKIDDTLLDKVIEDNNLKPRYICGYSNITARNDIEKSIADIWNEILFIEEKYLDGHSKSLYVDANFFHLGGTSLMCSMMLMRIEKLFPGFNATINYPIFEENPTIGALARIISRMQAKRNGDYQSAVVKLGGNFAEDKPLPPDVVPLWMPASLMGIPYHDYQIFVDEYADKTRPIFGLQARGITNPSEVSDSLTEMARCHLEDVYAIQKHEPYLFFGWSGGGLLANEMARIARSQGKIAYAVMIDSESPTHLRSRDMNSFAGKYFFRLIKDSAIKAKLKIKEENISYVTQTINGAILDNTMSIVELSHFFFTELGHSLRRSGVDDKNVFYFIEYLRGFFIAALKYEVSPIAEGVTLVTAAESVKQVNERLGWPDSCHLDFVHSTGNHFSVMLKPPFPINYAELVMSLQREANAAIFDAKARTQVLPEPPLRGAEADTYQIPNETSHNIRREAFISQLTQPLANGRSAFYIISGAAGVGKSAITQSVCHDCQTVGSYTKILWLNGANDLAQEFRLLADHLEVPREITIDQTLKLLWHKLRNERVLLAIDNVENVEDLYVRNYISPEDYPRALQVIVTTQRNTSKHRFKEIKVAEFSLSEAMTFLKNKFKNNQDLYDETAALHICSDKMLDRHPLSLMHAATFMLQNNVRMQDYIERFRRESPITTLPTWATKESHVQNAFKTIAMSIDNLPITNPRAFAVLEMCSFMNSNLIPKTLLRYVLGFENDVKGFNQLTDFLQRKGLISIERGGHFVKLHSLVQEFVQFTMSPLKKQQTLESLVKHFAEIFTANSHSLMKFKRNIYTHAQKLIATYLEKDALPPSLSVIQFYHSLALYIVKIDQSDYGHADEYIFKAMALEKTLDGYSQDNILVQELWVTLIKVKIGLGNFPMAKDLCLTLLKENDLVDPLKEKINYLLGSMYFSERKISEARKYLGLAPNVTEAHSLLGLIEFCFRQKEKSCHHYEKAIELSKASETDPLAYADTLINYGSILPQYGRVAEGRQYMERALEIYEAQVGSRNHRKIITIYTYLGFCYHKEGLHGIAMEKLRVAEGIKLNLWHEYGLSSDQDALNYSFDMDLELATMYLALSRYGEAKIQIDKLSQNPTRNDNPNIQVVLGHYAAAMENYDEAIAFYIASKNIRLRMSRDEKDTHYIDCLIRVANITMKKGQLAEAQTQLDALKIEYAALDPKRKCSETEYEIDILQARLHLACEEGPEALTILQRIMPTTRERYPDPKSAYVLSIHLLIAKANLLCDECDTMEVIKSLEFIRQHQLLTYGLNEHAEIAETLQCFAKAHAQLGEDHEACEFQTKAIAMMKSILKNKPGATHSRIAQAEAKLADYQRLNFRN